MINWIKKADSVKFNEFLSTDEYKCHCKYENCTRTLYQESTIDSFLKTRMEFGKKIKVNSAFRCQKHNEDEGGKPNSFHTLGAAMDLAPIAQKDLRPLIEIASKYFDVVIPYPTFVHCHNVD